MSEWKNPPIEHPELEAAQKLATDLVERAHLNEAIKVIEELETKVASMPIANRFSRDRKMSEDGQGVIAREGMVPPYSTMTEADHKRASLELDLAHLKNDIGLTVHRLKALVLDIEATQRD